MTAEKVKVQWILNAVYVNCQTLEEFCAYITYLSQGNDEHPQLDGEFINNTDKPEFIKFMKSTLVATPIGTKSLTSKFDPRNTLSQSDILVSAIERIKDKKRKNILTLGCGTMSTNPSAQVWSSRNFEYVFPNQSISSLLQPQWKILLSRIGDEVMSFLLENRAVFVLITETCYNQLTGTPICDMCAVNDLKLPKQQHNRTQISKRFHTKIKQKCRKSWSSQKHSANIINTDGNKRKRKFSAVGDESPCSDELQNITISRSKKRKHEQHCSSDIDSWSRSTERSSVLHKRDFDVEKLVSQTLAAGEKDLNSAFCCFTENNESGSDNIRFASQGMGYSDPGDKTELHFTLNTTIEDTNQCHQTEAAVDDTCNKLATHDIQEINPNRLSTNNERYNYKASDHLILDNKLKLFNLTINDKNANNRKRLQDNSLDLSSKKPKIMWFEDFSKTSTLSSKYSPIIDHKHASTTSKTCKTQYSKYVEVVEKANSANQKEDKDIDFLSYNFHTYFNRTGLLYCKNMNETFFKKHVLEQPNVDMCSISKELVEHLLKTKVLKNNSTSLDCIKTILTIKHKLQTICEVLVQNHRKCNYRQIFSYYAPFPKSNARKMEYKHFSQHRQCSSPANKINLSSSPGKTMNVCHQQFCGEKQAESAINGVGVPAKCENYTPKPEKTLLKATNILETKSNSVHQKYTGCHKSYHKKLKSSRYNLKELIGCHIPQRQVFLFIRRLYLAVIPKEMLGSKQNDNAILKGIDCILRLGKFEKFCLGQIMTNIKISHCKWLPKKLPHSLKEGLVAKVIYWLVDSYMFVILKSFLYITETTAYRNRLFYYRKSIWSKISLNATEEFISKHELKEVNSTGAISTVESGLCLGIAQMRLMPKRTSVRPIVNMGRKVLWGPKKGSTINRQIQNVLSVLSTEKDKNPSLVGSSQFGATDIYKTWRKFVLDRKARGDTRPLYFVKSDIENCYDSIDQTKLYEIIDKCLKQEDSGEEYVVRRYSTTHLALTNIKHTYHREVTHLDEFEPNFTQYVRRLSREKSKTHAVYVDQVMHLHETRENLMKTLKKHLFGNLIQVGKKFYRRLIGISQGSILSTILCNYYYGDMENRHLTLCSDELLMRQVDDFFLATPCLDSARHFLQLLLYGLSQYNCKVSREKTLVNFELIDESTVPQLPSEALFPWCGLLFNPCTLEVMTDYTRYVGLKVTDIVTFNIAQHVCHNMRTKLQKNLPQKNQYICLDPEINTDDTIISTLYKIFTLTAYKFHAYVKKLPYNQGIAENPEFFLEIITSLPSHLLHQIRSSFSKNKTTRISPVLTLVCLKWICLKAFKAKLIQHQGRYQVAEGQFLKELQSQLTHIKLSSYLMILLKSFKDRVIKDLDRDFMNIL